MNKNRYLRINGLRRKLLFAGVAWPVLSRAGGVRAQANPPGKIWRVGILVQRARPVSIDADAFGAFVRGMRDLGYVEGKNLVIEWRFADGKADLLPALAEELARIKVDVIVATSTPTTSALQKATTTIPIVMGPIADPVGSGFIKSLARPGGNITGLTNMLVDLSAKHLELLLSVTPKPARVAVLLQPDNASNIDTLKVVQLAAKRTGISVLSAQARTRQDIENAFSRIVREKSGAVLLAQDGLFIENRRMISDLATKHRLPSIGAIRELAEDGILISYGPSFSDIYRRVAIHVDKILKGAKPADLPVEQPIVFELVINGKTANALSLKIPQALLISANKVIE